MLVQARMQLIKSTMAAQSHMICYFYLGMNKMSKFVAIYEQPLSSVLSCPKHKTYPQNSLTITNQI